MPVRTYTITTDNSKEFADHGRIIDLIPDFIPIFGYLDDLIITPLGLALALKMIPEEVMVEAHQEAEISMGKVDRVARVGMIIVVSIWILIGVILLYCILKVIRS